MLKGLITASVLATSFAFSQSGMYGQNYGGHSYRQGDVFSSLKEATSYLVKAKKQLRTGRHYEVRSNIFKANIKIRILGIQIRNKHRLRQAADALMVAADKTGFQSPLNSREKISWGLECLHYAMTSFINVTYRGKRAVRKHIQVSKQMVQSGLFDLAADSLNESLQFISPYSQTGSALEVAAEKIQSPYLSPREKRTWFYDCVNQALQYL